MSEATATASESPSDASDASETTGGSETTEASTTRKVRKVREGVVTSAAMDKTVVVTVIDRVRHAKYNKYVQRTKKLYCHDEANDAGLGDRVRVMETRPLSKTKRWRVVEILERAR
jgi:small subunit ribosomal protein S17